MAADILNPAGGPELYKMLVALATEYRLRAVVDRDFDSGAIALALQALVIHAAGAGLHIHLQFLQEGTT
jgi:hypothetical protein